jgi:hypothetical protein
MSAVEELATAIGELAVEHASMLLTMLERDGRRSEREDWNIYDAVMCSLVHRAAELTRERTDIFRNADDVIIDADDNIAVERLLTPAMTNAAKRMHTAAGCPSPITVRQRAHLKALAGDDGVERYVVGRLRLAIEGRDVDDSRRQRDLAMHGLRHGIGELR